MFGVPKFSNLCKFYISKKRVLILDCSDVISGEDEGLSRSGGLGLFEAALLLEHERLAARLTPWERGQGDQAVVGSGLDSWTRLRRGGWAKEESAFTIGGRKKPLKK